MRRRAIWIWLMVLTLIGVAGSTPQPLQAQTPDHYLVNQNGGGDPATGLRIRVNDSSIAIEYGNQLVTAGTAAAPVAGPVLYVDGVLYGAPQLTSLIKSQVPSLTVKNWDSVTLTETTPNYMVDHSFTVDLPNNRGTIQVAVAYIYNSVPTEEASAIVVFGAVTPNGADFTTAALYFVADLNAAGVTANATAGDSGFSYGTPSAVNPLVVHVAESLTAVGFNPNLPVIDPSNPPGLATSWMAGPLGCILGSNASSCNAGSTSAPYGPANGTAYPAAEIAGSNLAIGLHWPVDKTAVQVRTEFNIVAHHLINENYVPPPDVTPTAVPAANQPAECDLDPDMAITPEAISLADANATVTVTLRNRCADAPLSGNDLLLSLSDGLRIVGGSNGLVNLGQRGAFQRFTLGNGETRSYVFEVEAASALTAAPQHVVELYRLGGVAKRIDGVFVGATVAAPAAPAAPAPAAPAEPAAPAPLPTALPNTAGEESILLLLGLLGLAAIGIGLRNTVRR